MPNSEHVEILHRGVEAWNKWRTGDANAIPNLEGVDLGSVDLEGFDLRKANLSKAFLIFANMKGVNLAEANLSHANLLEANLAEANLKAANLNGAFFTSTKLAGADLSRVKCGLANFVRADLTGATLTGSAFIDSWFAKANLTGANLEGADLSGTSFTHADLSGANLSGANLSGAMLQETNLTNADLTGSRVYGASAWDLKLERAKQQNLVITRDGEPSITVDNIDVAQFIFLLLHNQKIRDVIDTINSKAVLILGRFTDERKPVLDAIREDLRRHHYLPILFDSVPATRDTTETISLLARVARFIVADLTEPSSIPEEFVAIVPHLAVPVQPLIEGSSRPYAMFTDYWKYDWVLPVYRYEGLEPLLATLSEKIIAPAEAKIETAQIAKERKNAILQSIASPSNEYAIAFDPGAAEQRAMLGTTDRIELEDLIEQLSADAAELESQASGGALQATTKSKRVEIYYLIDQASHRISITAVRQGASGFQASASGANHA
jgi:uncharacterized protein YjbI with pentapeptide repeats